MTKALRSATFKVYLEIVWGIFVKKLFQSARLQGVKLIVPIVILLGMPTLIKPASCEPVPAATHTDFRSLDPKKIHGRYLLENLDQFDQAAFEKFLNTISWGLTMPHCMVSMKVGKDRADQLTHYSPILSPLLQTKKSLKNTHFHIHTHFSQEERLAIANEYLTYYLSFGGDKDAVDSVHELTLKKLEVSETVTVPNLVHQIKHNASLRDRFERTKYEFLIGLAVLWIQRERYEAMRAA
jgi:hypothetical protein